MAARLIALLAASLVMIGCGSKARVTADPPTDDGPRHVHGIAVLGNRLFLGTHTGLFRMPLAGGKAVRVGDSRQDIMGLTSDPGRLLASGHPELGDTSQSPHLGLIASIDHGRTWRNVSLLGSADFHVLRAAGRRLYGFDGATLGFLASTDGGRTWTRRQVPAPVVDLAVDPGDSQHLVATTEEGLASSGDGGRRWRILPPVPAGVLAWPRSDRLFIVGAKTFISTDAGKTWLEGPRLNRSTVATTAVGGAVVASSDLGTIDRLSPDARSWQRLGGTPPSASE